MEAVLTFFAATLLPPAAIILIRHIRALRRAKGKKRRSQLVPIQYWGTQTWK